MKWLPQRYVCLLVVLSIRFVAFAAAPYTTLPENRVLDFNDYALTNNFPNPTWVHQGVPMTGLGSYQALLRGTNHFHRTGWVFLCCRLGSAYYQSGGRAIPNKIPSSVPVAPYYLSTNMAANLQNNTNALIESPVFTNGIGTIYFEAINNLDTYKCQITVEICTNMQNVSTWDYIPLITSGSTNNYVYNWTNPKVVDLDISTANSNNFVRYSQVLNIRDPAKMRIRRTGDLNSGSADSTFTVIDNIRVSSPPTDVVVTKSARPFEPGYPSVGTNVTVRCYVSNVDTNAPTDTRRVKVVYRWRYLDQQIDPWRTNDMAYVSGTGTGSGNGLNNLYSSDLPKYTRVGDLEYFFFCEHEGLAYQSPDLTKTTPAILGSAAVYGELGYPYRSEVLPTRVLRSGGSSEFSVRIRPYNSVYGKLSAKTDLLPDPIEMELCGDKQWRAMVPIAGTGTTNLTWYFKAAEEYIPGTGLVSTDFTYWAGVSGVVGGRVPYGGVCVPTNNTGRLSVIVDSGNYIMLTLNTDPNSLQYIATRAEYQNFNRWPAPVDVFTESNGQDPKHSYLNTFDQWPTNQYSTSFEPIADYVTTTNVYKREPFTTPGNWVAGSAAYVSERPLVDNTVNAVAGAVKFRNLGLRLKGGNGVLGLGYVQNSAVSLTDGLKEFRFKSRLGQEALSTDVAYYRYGFTNNNYTLRLNMQSLAGGAGPETPSVSLIGYYQGPGLFYEYRVSQVKDPSDTISLFKDRTLRHELYKWANGTAVRLGNPLDVTNSFISVNTLAELRFYNTSGASTLVKCSYGGTDRLTITDNTSPVIQGGSFGVLSADCRAGFSEVYILSANSSADVPTGASANPMLLESTFASDSLNWYVPYQRFEMRNDVSPKGIYSVVPTQQVGIYTQDTVYNPGHNANASAPGAGWNLLTTITVSNFTYQTTTVPINFWKPRFVMLQVLGGGADVAVDELSVTSWHGTTVGLGDFDNFEWLANEAWVVSNATSMAHVMQLDHSRGGREVNALGVEGNWYDQAVRSLMLTNGLGQMEFDYRVVRAPARLKIQYALEDDSENWLDVKSVTVTTNETGWSHVSAYNTNGMYQSGFFRVLNDRSDIYTNAFVELNDVMVWDEPPLTNNSWRTYNTKITKWDLQRVALDQSAACFLNNSTTLETRPDQTEFQPFVQSPELPKGLGEISFYSRAYTNQPTATLYLYGSTNGWNPQESQWFEITHWTVTNNVYELYGYKPDDGRKYNAIRLGTLTSGSARRVCLEDVVINEPVFPGFDIVNVSLVSMESGNVYVRQPQPLAGQAIDVEARLGNIQLAPSNIVMYVSYYVGTNVWGVGNWPAAKTVTKRMHLVDASEDPSRTLYRTRLDNGGVIGLESEKIGNIAGQDADDVIQYYVWADYDGGVRLKAQQSYFENPAWYYPINLNTRFAAKGWSPYYIAYNVAPNAVWINEVNVSDYTTNSTGSRLFTVGDNQYIEIATPAWLDLSGWSVDIVSGVGYSTTTVKIPANQPSQVALTNGYAFFVIGASTAGTVPLPKKDFGVLGLSLPVGPAGLRLRRPMGMYEQTIAYDKDPTKGSAYSGVLWADNDPQKHFVYVGREYWGGSLARIGKLDNTNNWVFPQTWTPGSPNIGQQYALGNGDALQPGVSNVWITSEMNAVNGVIRGSQNGKRATSYALKMRMNQATNIIYQTDNWYHLYSLQVNNVEQMSAGEKLTGLRTFDLVFPNLTGDVAVNANVQMRKDLSVYSGEVLSWILSYPEGSLVPSYYAKSSVSGWAGFLREMTMTEQYWLNADPTVTNRFVFRTASFNKDPVTTNLYFSLEMAMNGNKQTVLQGGEAVLKLQAKAGLTGTEWVLVAQYNISDASYSTNAVPTCYVFVKNPFSAILKGMNPDSVYYRWKIEMRDPRVEVKSLVNGPAYSP